MTNEKEREEILFLLRKIWDDNPGWRLGQILSLATPYTEDTYHVKDSVIKERLIKLAESGMHDL